MLKNKKSANCNEHQNRKTEVFWHKNRKTDLKNSQNRKSQCPPRVQCKQDLVVKMLPDISNVLFKHVVNN